MKFKNCFEALYYNKALLFVSHCLYKSNIHNVYKINT